jgi:hypothetical protein
MSGMILRVIPFIKYDFGNLSAGQAATFPLAMHIDVSVFTEVDLIVRARSGSIASGNFLVALIPDGYTFDDPATNYFPATPPAYGDAGTAYFDMSATFPSYQVSSVGQNLGSSSAPTGRLIAVGLVATQGESGGALMLEFSADLVLKGGNPRALPMMPNGYRGYRIM